MNEQSKVDKFKIETLEELIKELTATAEQRLEMICKLHDDLREAVTVMDGLREELETLKEKDHER